MLSVTLIQLGSECDPEPVPRPMGIRTLSQYPKWSLCTPTSISSSISAIDSSPKRDTPCRLTLSLSRYQSKEPPGSRAAHGTQHGQTGPCGCLPSHRGLQLQEKPVSTHGLIGFKLLSGQLRAFGCRGGKRRATHAEWSRRQEGSVIAGELLQALFLHRACLFSTAPALVPLETLENLPVVWNGPV